MKQSLLLLLFSTIIFFYHYIIPYNKEIITAIIFSFIPSLLPCLILTNLIIASNSLIVIYDKLKNNKLGCYIYALILIFISVSLGMPSMQLLLLDQYKKGIIDKKSFNNFIYSFGTISFPFIYGICIYNIQNNHISILILVIHYFTNFISLLILGFNINNININIKSQPLIHSLNESFIKSIKTLSIITCSVSFFSLGLFALEKINTPLKWLVEGLIEFSYPCLKASQSNNSFAYAIILFISLFPSLSIIIQSKIINNDLNIKKYTYIRFIITGIGITLFTLLFFLIK